jgi:hypothetical protein
MRMPHPARRSGLRVIALALLIVPAVSLQEIAAPPPAMAATCMTWTSTALPPVVIRVLRTGSGAIDTVDFETYVEKVMAAEWPSSWPIETLKAGAVAIKQYAWYKALTPRTGSAGCYDVRDDSLDQLYSPAYSPTANHILAVESTWDQSVLRSGSFILTGYGPGADVACGSDANGSTLRQQSSRRCGLNGMKWADILLTYYSPGGSIQNPPSLPGPPTGVTAAPFDASAFVSWSPPDSDGYSAIRSYTVTSTPDGRTCATTGTLTCAVQGLSNGTAYAFTVTATNLVGTGPSSDVSASATPAPPVPATYHAVTPTRLLDSRSGLGLAGAFSSHVARTFQVAGGVVPAGSTAVTGNLTVTQQSSLGFLFAGPIPADNPTSSTLNFPKGDDRANAVTVALSPLGTLSVTYAAPTLGPTAQVIFDVTGYFTPDRSGATYHPLIPQRLVDSRTDKGIAGVLQSHVSRSFDVAGAVVPAGATAVTGTLTVTQQNAMGFLYIGPAAADDPASSNLNFPIGDDRANAVTVALGEGGKLFVTYAAPTLGPTAHVIFDVTGYFSADGTGASYVPMTPRRILDSRNGTGGITGPLSSHVARTFAVESGGGIPEEAVAVSGNLTVTQQSSPGFLYLGPDKTDMPTSSTLNFPNGDDRANAVTLALDSAGNLSLTFAAPTLGPSAHAVFDLTGYFVPAASR